MPLAREGWREMAVGTVVLALLAGAAVRWCWPLAPLCAVLWVWLIAFFRDPHRSRDYAPGDLCAPADGTVTEISELEHYGPIEGPALRIGLFLSIFNVHVNRSPCAGRVRRLEYRPGRFLDARHPESGKLNESNAVTLSTRPPMPGPVVVRQVAGLLARRIVCHGRVGEQWTVGERFGLIKFGSRTELIIPRYADTEVCVAVGDRVRAGLTILARQPLSPSTELAEPRTAAIPL